MARKNGFSKFERTVRSIAGVSVKENAVDKGLEKYYKGMFEKGYLPDDKALLLETLEGNGFHKPFYFFETPQGGDYWYSKKYFRDLTEEDFTFLKGYYDYIKFRLQDC